MTGNIYILMRCRADDMARFIASGANEVAHQDKADGSSRSLLDTLTSDNFRIIHLVLVYDDDLNCSYYSKSQDGCFCDHHIDDRESN